MASNKLFRQLSSGLFSNLHPFLGTLFLNWIFKMTNMRSPTPTSCCLNAPFSEREGTIIARNETLILISTKYLNIRGLIKLLPLVKVQKLSRRGILHSKSPRLAFYAVATNKLLASIILEHVR